MAEHIELYVQPLYYACFFFEDIAASNISTAWPASCSVLWTYVFNVVRMSECPNRSWTALTFAPDSIKNVACECLSE